MKRHAIKLMGLLGLALVLALLVPQHAAAEDDDDPPGRVARLSFVRGTVSFQPAGTEDWVSAVLNRPLTTGDKLWNDNDSVSELHLGSAAIRVGSNTGISFLNLTDSIVQVSLTEGTLNIRVRRLADDETFEVDTPNLALTLLRPGDYKVNVNESGDATVVLVREGQGEVTGGGAAYAVHPREFATFTGTDQIDADVQDWDNTSDDFDNWCAERESRVDHSTSAQYVSDDVIGYEDLDEYGGWRPVSEYGTVWFPRVSIVGWAPYHYGHWVYIAPWGYTWVDDAPWGFAPFHYGRWVVVGGVWGWVPAPPRTVVGVYVRPVYAPALVAWVGGPHFGVGVGVGASVGWFPLGPREVYVPSYHVSRAYVTNINVTNTRVTTVVVNNYYENTVIRRNATNVVYVNQRVPGAVMATTSVAFTSAQPVSRNVVHVDQREVVSASVGYGAPAVAPTRQAVLGAGVAVRTRPPMVVENRAVVARHTPPPPPPSFARRQQAIEANGGRPLAPSQVRQIQPEAAQTRSNIRLAPGGAKVQNIPVNRTVQPNRNRPVAPNDGSNRSGNPAGGNPNDRTRADRPPSSRTNPPANTTKPDQTVGTPPSSSRANPPRETPKPDQTVNAPPPSSRTNPPANTPKPDQNVNAPKPAPRAEERPQAKPQQVEKERGTEKQKKGEEKKKDKKPPKPPKEDKPSKHDR